MEELKKPVPQRKHEFSSDYFWDEPVTEKENLAGYQPPAKSGTKVDSRRPMFGCSSNTLARSSSAERKKTIRRPETTPQVYIQTAATDSLVWAQMKTSDTARITKPPKPNQSDRARREPTPPQLPTFWGQQTPKPTTRPIIAAARKTAAQTWTQVPFARLPESMMFWDSKNTRTARNWASRQVSAIEVANQESWTTKKDIQETEDHYLLKITPAHRVNLPKVP